MNNTGKDCYNHFVHTMPLYTSETQKVFKETGLLFREGIL